MGKLKKRLTQDLTNTLSEKLEEWGVKSKKLSKKIEKVSKKLAIDIEELLAKKEKKKSKEQGSKAKKDKKSKKAKQKDKDPEKTLSVIDTVEEIEVGEELSSTSEDEPTSSLADHLEPEERVGEIEEVTIPQETSTPQNEVESTSVAIDEKVGLPDENPIIEESINVAEVPAVEAEQKPEEVKPARRRVSKRTASSSQTVKTSRGRKRPDVS